MYIQSMLGGGSTPSQPDNLWHNSNVKVSLGDGDITLSHSIANYDHIKFVFYWSTGEGSDFTNEVIVDTDFLQHGTSYKMNVCLWNATPSTSYFRLIKYVNDSKLHINNCFTYPNATASNGYLIVADIYGIHD